MILFDSIALLDVLIFEKEFGLMDNSYSADKMKYLCRNIGPEKISELLEGVYYKALVVVTKNNYKIPNYQTIQEHITASWDRKALENALRKIQKYLEIYYVRNCTLYPDYDTLFGYNKELDVKSIVITESKEKLIISRNASAYNKEAKLSKKFFKENLNLPLESKDEVEVTCKLISDYMTKNITHPELNDKFKQALFDIDQCIKLSHINEIISRNFIRTNIRREEKISIDKMVEVKSQYYIRTINKLNQIYGSSRYSMILPTDEDIKQLQLENIEA